MPVEPRPAANFIAQMLQEGRGVTESRNLYRQVEGGRIANATFSQLWGEVGAALANREHLGGLDPTLNPSFDSFTPWSAGKGNTFMYQVDVLVRNPEFDTVYRVPFSYVTDRVVSPMEAMDYASDLYADAADNYGETVHGTVLTGLYSMGAK